ncbi:hypothetical protein K438DRAFT_1776039 [Mycena galopus ATCC 62051]|nr:hypothetical protein K438DRAFT_1776039 [Mycena galopus ATCC 62051]
MFNQVLAKKPGVRRKLETTDLKFSRKPLWRIVKKELWPSGRKRSVLAVALADNYWDVPGFCVFFPPTHIHLYLPTLLAFAKAFNSTIIDERILEFAGELYEEHILDVPVGTNRNASTTSSHADNLQKWALRIKKSTSWQQSLAKMLVYSKAVDGPARTSLAAMPWTSDKKLARPTGVYVRREKHQVVPQLYAEFCTQRLTSTIRRAFVTSLRMPALLAMFSKDPVSMVLEQSLIMPELLERAYSGLKVVNETHRTTALLTMLNAITWMLVSENLGFGGQKHLGLLLELSLTGTSYLSAKRFQVFPPPLGDINNSPVLHQQCPGLYFWEGQSYKRRQSSPPTCDECGKAGGREGGRQSTCANSVSSADANDSANARLSTLSTEDGEEEPDNNQIPPEDDDSNSDEDEELPRAMD